MNTGYENRGAAPVAMLDEMPRLEAAVVIYLRLWCDSPEGQASVWQDFSGFYDAKTARTQMARFEQLLSMVLSHSRRPMQRHNVKCACVGGDECAFANFIVSAALGEPEDAMLLASNFMRPDMAVVAANMAGPVGLALSQMVAPVPPPYRFSNTPDTKH